VLASTAIPLVFPWVRGEWDGALLQYAPLKPAVLLGATEIVVVPIHNPDPDAGLPEGILQTVMRVLDFSLTPLKTDIRRILERNEDPDYRTVDVNVISPTRPFGYSKLDFSSPQKESAICHGRNRAYQVMSDDHV
jgi:predicted acylesterase/phospholipase RssA